MATNISLKENPLEHDLSKIYLGNLSTVDTDLNLPTRGEKGSIFIWETSAEYLISTQGKVTRPQYGAGNRKVTLTVTAELDGKKSTKEFVANVIEKEYNATIIYAYSINIATKIGVRPNLPSVAVIKNDLKEDAVVPVQWENVEKESYMAKSSFTVKGKVKDDVQVTANVTVTDDIEIICPHIDNKKQVIHFSHKETELLQDSDFKAAQDRNLKFVLSVNDDVMLYNFRVVANLDTKNAKPMTGWDAPECNLKGHTTGHYLSSLALCYAATFNNQVKEKLDYMIDQLYICQKSLEATGKCKKGFLSAYDEQQFDLLEEFTTYPTIWAPYYTLHKIMAGLRDCYLLAESAKALEIYTGLGDWVYNRLQVLSQEQRSKMWGMYIAGEYGGMNEVMADLYIITQEEKYITASRYFDNEKLYLPMQLNIDALGNLHANQHIPQVIGALRQFSVTGEKKYFDIANNFWNMVTSSHIYSIGGTGETEMFKSAGKIADYISEKTAESCASYNMLKLTKELYCYNPDVKYMDYYEKTMYNHILSCGDISASNGGSTYFMPTSPCADKHFDLHENSCCHGTGMENHFKYAESVYFHDKESLFVNLYIPSKLEWKEKALTCNMAVLNDAKDIKATLKISAGQETDINLRLPYWAKAVTLEINEKIVKSEGTNGYIKARLQKGEAVIKISFLCTPWLSKTPDKPQYASVCYGPYVLAALSDIKDYLEFKIDDNTVQTQLKSKGEMKFEMDGVEFVPISHIGDLTPYHLYIKTKQN